ncbi:Por secretion system C-terminal sorting domain-containing protein [Candidatus Kryptobacter tengchongensis]|nr:Por secretion system C-terminal sorting domain-containing protein [Candidatus Kryptobacter tengchongensis]
MNRVLLILGLLTIIYGVVFSQSYVGTDRCLTCHAYVKPVAKDYKQTLHAKIHLLPTSETVRGDFTQTVSMGSSYGNALVRLRTDGSKWYAKLVPSSGDSVEYEIAYVYGFGWKQRYLVKIDSSYYMLPIQWNLKGYLDNSTGNWTSYNPGNWFNSDGTLKSTKTNSFRAKSYDKNCAGCHVTGLNITKYVSSQADTFWIAKWANNNSINDMIIGCESCHGPGSDHASTGDKTKIINPKNLSYERQLEVCGQCHFRGSSNNRTHEYPWDETNNKGYIPGDSLGLYIIHNPGLWPDNYTSRQHHQQYNDLLKSKHYSNPYHKVTCFECHNPHKVTSNPHQVVDSLYVRDQSGNYIWIKTKNNDNTLCLACHAGYGPFAGLTRAMIMDPVANRDTIASVVSRHTHHSYDPENRNNTGGTSRCSKCHMAKTATTAKAYDIHSHTFEVISPKKTLDYRTVTTPTKGMLNSCAASCHRNPTGNIPNFGVPTDANLTDWTEATDIQLADSLWFYFRMWWPTKVEQIASIVSKFEVFQNYPNPFNPTTTIEFAIPKRVNVKLIIYDLTGKVVKTLIDGQEYEAGLYRVEWNGKNDYGEYVSSGIYFYRLEAGDFVATKKMVLVR